MGLCALPELPGSGMEVGEVFLDLFLYSLWKRACIRKREKKSIGKRGNTKMTRLKEDWIRDIQTGIREYDREIVCKTGMTLLELAAAANEIHPDRIREAAESYKAAAHYGRKALSAHFPNPLPLAPIISAFRRP